MAIIGIICAYDRVFKPPRCAVRDTAFDGFRGLGFAAGRSIYVYEKENVVSFIAYVPLGIRKRAFRRLSSYLASKGAEEIIPDQRLWGMERFLPEQLRISKSGAFEQRLAPTIARKVLKSKGLFYEHYHLAAVISDLSDENKSILRDFSEDCKEMTLVMKNMTLGKVFASELMREYGIVIRVSDTVPKSCTVVWREGDTLDLNILGKNVTEVRVMLPAHRALFELPEIDTTLLLRAIWKDLQTEPLKFTKISCV